MSTTAPARALRVAYLINQYPKTSHSFVRREIAALEALGLEIARFSIRPVEEALIEPADVEEQGRTRFVLDAGVAALLAALVTVALLRPLRFCRAFALTLRLARRSERGWLRPFAWLVEGCWLARLLQRDGVAHVHAHFGTNSTAVAMLAHEVGGPAFSFTAHGTESFDAPPMIALDEKLRRATFAVAVSQWGKAQLMRWCEPSEWGKLHVVRCGVDRAFLEGPSTPPGARRLLCVARLSPEKGLDILVEAAALLLQGGVDFELRIVGDGELRPALENRIRAAGLREHVQLLGWGDAALVRREMEAARVLVVPSLAEGLPVVIMEALAMGRPVVASAVGAIAELVQGGVTGWLVPPGSPSDLARALSEALRLAPQQLADLGRRGAALIAQRHDAANEAGRLAALLRGENVTSTAVEVRT